MFTTRSDSASAMFDLTCKNMLDLLGYVCGCALVIIGIYFAQPRTEALEEYRRLATHMQMEIQNRVIERSFMSNEKRYQLDCMGKTVGYLHDVESAYLNVMRTMENSEVTVLNQIKNIMLMIMVIGFLLIGGGKSLKKV